MILDGEVGRTGRSRSWQDAAAIRRAHPTLPVLMFTADADALAEERAGISARSREAGFVGVVSKPFVVEEFLATLKGAVQAPPPASSDAIVVFPDPSGPSAAEWARIDFFTAAVHELKTPLATISGQMQLARKLMLKDPVRGRAAMELAFGQIERMTGATIELSGERDPEWRVDIPGEADRRGVRDKLSRQVADLDAGAARSRAKLANPGFVSKAPPEVVEGERHKLAELERQVEAVREELDHIGA